MDRFFKQLMGKEINPYPFQKIVYTSLLEGRNIILRAPTGAGKTISTLLPFIHSYIEEVPFVDRVIYALPLRSLANNLYDTTGEQCKRVINVVHKPKDNLDLDKLAVTIQTGQFKNDPFFQGDIIFTTIDQLLSAYLNIPLSLPSKLANINGGTLVGSLIIIDEFHLLDPNSSLKTTIEMMDRLNPFSQFVLMTATMSKKTIQMVNDILKGKIIEVFPEQLVEMPVHANKKRQIEVKNSILSIEAILENYNGESVLVICNTVDKAQRIFEELRELKPAGCEIILLHSRFLPFHRKDKEQTIINTLGPDDKTPRNIIVVSTQVVEAGIDISVDIIHTEICPANSLIQRAGRTARYSKPRNNGRILIYDLEANDNGEKVYAPYEKELVEKTLMTLQGAIKEKPKTQLDNQFENFLVEEVHSLEEELVLKDLTENLKSLKKLILMTIYSNDKSKVNELIRDIDSINLVITDYTEINLTSLPPIFSVPSKSLFKLDKLLKDNPEELLWMLEFDEQEKVTWLPSSNIVDVIKGRAWLIAVSPKIISYDEEIGLRLGYQGKAILEPKTDLKVIEGYEYDWEPYIEHVTAILKEVDLYLKVSLCGMEKISKKFRLTTSELEKIIKFSTSFHDIGKLTKGWQDPALRWQRRFYPQEIITNEPVAHVTYRKGDWIKAKSKEFKRENHSIEGAFSIAGLCKEFLSKSFKLEPYVFKGIFFTIITAIAKHHSTGNLEPHEFRLTNHCKEANLLTQKLLGLSLHGVLLEPASLKDRVDFKDYCLLKADSIGDHFLVFYQFLVRTLRLSDQIATKKGGEESNGNQET